MNSGQCFLDSSPYSKSFICDYFLFPAPSFQPSSLTFLSVPELAFKADLTWHIGILFQFPSGTILFLGNVIC